MEAPVVELKPSKAPAVTLNSRCSEYHLLKERSHFVHIGIGLINHMKPLLPTQVSVKLSVYM